MTQDPIDHIDFPVTWEQSPYRIVAKVRRTSTDKITLGIRPFFLGFNQVVIDAAIEHPAHQHSSYEIILVEKGPYRCRLNEEEVELDSSSCLFLKPGDWHEVQLVEGQRHYVLQFDLEDKALAPTGSPSIFRRTITPSEQACHGPVEDLKPILEMIAKPLRRSSRFAAEIQDCLTEYLFWRLLSHLPEERLAPALVKASQDQKFIDQLEQVEQDHFAQNLNLEKLARLMEVSKSTLAKRCAGLLGESPGHFLNRRKINRAIVALRSTDKSIKEISFDLGFQNPYHFSRVFKRTVGSSPSEYRTAAADTA